MQSYVVLVRFTERGARDVSRTIDRARRIRVLLEQRGMKLASIYWTQGQYDLVVTIEAPDSETVMAAMFAIADAGYVRTETLRAFSEEEMEGIVGRV